jgi:hypothetical protein
MVGDLGSILWNFKDLTMEFTIGQQHCLLQGLGIVILWEELETLNPQDESHKGLMLQLL